MITPMRLRIARHTDRLEEVVAFYRDRVGFLETGSFKHRAGFDGVLLEIPRTGTELELTSGGTHRAPEPHPESLLVLFFDSQAELNAVARRIAQPPVTPANPHSETNAKPYADPDGFQLLPTLG